jgi:hypothetical protein
VSDTIVPGALVPAGVNVINTILRNFCQKNVYFLANLS